MTTAAVDVVTTHFILPPDARCLPVAGLSGRLRARIGPVEEGQAVLTRPGFRIMTRLVPEPLAGLMTEFRTPSLLTDAVLRFARARDQDPEQLLDAAFEALATLVESRILVPADSTDAGAPDQSLTAGEEFAGFEIVRLVRGLDDSEVYRADAPDGTSVALKIARADQVAVATRLELEARVLRQLQGEDSPRLVSHGREQGRPYVAMEWCEGVSIATAAQRLRASRDPRQLQMLVARMCAAYGRLHRRGLLHGDVHPGNVNVTDDGRVVLLDFGTASVTNAADAVDPLRTGIAHFHDPQMAAALLAGAAPPSATPAAEQYAVAVLAYVLFTGLPPMRAPAVHGELLRSIVERPTLPFSARGVPAWPEVEAALQRALRKQPADRFPDACALADAIAAAAPPMAGCAALPRPATDALTASLHGVRELIPHEDVQAQVWFALRAALAFEDPELLAAADVLARRTGSCWQAHATRALVARARSDVRAEEQAIAGFLDATRTLRNGRAAAAALVTAAYVLDGAMSRAPNAPALGAWANRRLDRLMGVAAATHEPVRPMDVLRCRAALALGATDTVVVRPDLRTRLGTLRRLGAGGVWLWAAAYDVFGDDRCRDLALRAPLPRAPLARAFACLRRHQLTGEQRWTTSASDVVARAGGLTMSTLDTALLHVELETPHRVMLPPALVADAS